MNDSDHGAIVGCICATVAVVGIAWAIAWYNVSDTQARIQAGWVEVPGTPGTLSTSTHWEKR